MTIPHHSAERLTRAALFTIRAIYHSPRGKPGSDASSVMWRKLCGSWGAATTPVNAEIADSLADGGDMQKRGCLSSGPDVLRASQMSAFARRELQTKHYCDTLGDKLAPSFVADQMWMQRVHVIEPHDERR